MITRSRLKILTSGVLLVLIITLSAWTVVVKTRRQVGPQSPGSTLIFDDQSPHLIPATAFSSDGADLDSYRFMRSGGYMQGTSANGGCLKAAGIPATVGNYQRSQCLRL